MTPTSAADQCDSTLAWCRCELPAGHAPDAHVCSCNGAWDAMAEPILWPQGRTYTEAMAAIGIRV